MSPPWCQAFPAGGGSTPFRRRLAQRTDTDTSPLDVLAEGAKEWVLAPPGRSRGTTLFAVHRRAAASLPCARRSNAPIRRLAETSQHEIKKGRLDAGSEDRHSQPL